jgi:dTDP-glucose 4,6-dehydratase
MCYIVTGGCGFIGSNFVNMLAEDTDSNIIVLDNMTYAADENNINTCDRVRVIKTDIGEQSSVLDDIFAHNNVLGIFHFAAESHVDNSITGPRIFVDTNFVGTFNLLDTLRQRDWGGRFVHISTDEVYGALSEDGPSFLEGKLLEPNNVYSATKAGSDLLVRAYNKTYGLNVVTTRCCNNYGPRQDKEKLLPKVISNAINDVSIPIYGRGDQVREWIYVEDHCRAIWEIFKLGESGEIYNIGSGIEITNLELAKKVLSNVDKPYSLIKHVTDRLGHDFRYSIDSNKFRNLTQDFEFTDFVTGLKKTIQWYSK